MSTKDVGLEKIELAAPDVEAKATTAQAATIEAKPEPAAASTQTADDGAAEPSPEPRIGDGARYFPLAAIKPSATHRFALLATSVAIAAALGGLIGSFSTYGLATPKTETSTATAADATRQLQTALTQVTKDVAALKASIEAASRATTTQVSKITERFDRSERGPADAAAKIAALTDTVAKLEQRLAANAAHDVTGSIPERAAPKDAPKPVIVEGWVLRDIYRGRALVENRSGLYEVSPGGVLPGIGKVETITQQNGRWVVVTPKGLIVSMR